MLVLGVNQPANLAGGLLAYPISVLPAWSAITFFSALLGFSVLFVYKHTSNQRAIGAIRDKIKADLLAVRLFKGNIPLAVSSQARVMLSSLGLLGHSVVPLLVMIVPVGLILVQLGMWYQAGPAEIGKHPVVVKMKLKASLSPELAIMLKPNADMADLAGPVQVVSRNEIFWKIQPLAAGQTRLQFQVGDQVVEKLLSAGNGFMRISSKRPGMNWQDMLLYPLEPPIEDNSAVDSIEILYPQRKSHVYGTNWWLIYVFSVSMLFAFLLKPFLKVSM